MEERISNLERKVDLILDIITNAIDISDSIPYFWDLKRLGERQVFFKVLLKRLSTTGWIYYDESYPSRKSYHKWWGPMMEKMLDVEDESVQKTAWNAIYNHIRKSKSWDEVPEYKVLPLELHEIFLSFLDKGNPYQKAEVLKILLFKPEFGLPEKSERKTIILTKEKLSHLLDEEDRDLLLAAIIIATRHVVHHHEEYQRRLGDFFGDEIINEENYPYETEISNKILHKLQEMEELPDVVLKEVINGLVPLLTESRNANVYLFSFKNFELRFNLVESYLHDLKQKPDSIIVARLISDKNPRIAKLSKEYFDELQSK